MSLLQNAIDNNDLDNYRYFDHCNKSIEFLNYAIEKAQVKTIYKLVEKGWRFDNTNGPDNSMAIAIQRKDISIIKAILQKGCKFNN